MSTKTHTTTTHYHIQKKRRAEFIEEWRKYRQTVIREEDVTLVPTARGLRTGVYMGWDGDRPTRCLDALVHEVDPGTTTTIHRHSWDAILFMVDGSGWTEVDGVRYDWKPWDAIHLPAWSWHRHGNDGNRPGRFMSYSSEPTLWTLGMSLLEDARHEPFANLPPRPTVSPGVPGNDPYARRLRRIEQETKKRRSGRIHTPYDEQEILATPRGTRTKFLNDRAIGNQASGPHAGHDPVRAGQDPVAASPSRRSVALRGRGLRPQLHGHRARQRASTTAGRRATSSSSTTSSGTSTSTTTR